MRLNSIASGTKTNPTTYIINNKKSVAQRQYSFLLYKEKAEAVSLGFFSYKTGGTKDSSV